MKAGQLWEIFCNVIDNYGDIGVAWRLATDLAARDQQVRLWVDDASALDWMAPGAMQDRWPRVQVLCWDQADDFELLANLTLADIWIEAFGCAIPPALLQHRFGMGPRSPQADRPPPIWINLEYLSAESFVERAHGLPSPIMTGPAAGHCKFFFFPGFSSATGGLIHEAGLASRQAGFDRSRWLASQGVDWRGERLVSLFCYEPKSLAQLLEHWSRAARPTKLLVTHGRAAQAVRAILDRRPSDTPGGSTERINALEITFLQALTQEDFDHLLWACDLNFVRGEDSLVRAIWAEKAFVWQIYPQQDGAHHAKLQALMERLDAPASWRDFHMAWNDVAGPSIDLSDLESWARQAVRIRQRLRQQDDLVSRLLRFVESAPGRGEQRQEKR